MLDALDAKEKQPWVWQGADCAPGNTHCLVRLSPGGGDAATVREFDPTTKSFIKDGFALPLSKLNASYIDKDTVLFGTDFGPGTMTKSSYPRIVKLWHRSQKLTDAKTVYEAKPDDISATPVVFHGPYGTIALIARGVTFFTSEYYYVLPDGTTMKLPLPLGADLKGVTNGNLIFTLRDAWTPPGGKPIAQGALVAFPVKPFVMQKMLPTFEVLYTPNVRSTVGDVSAVRDAVYVPRSSKTSIYRIDPRSRLKPWLRMVRGATPNSICRKADRRASCPPMIGDRKPISPSKAS